MGQSIGMYTANIDQVVECMYVNLFQVQSQIYQIVVVLSFLIHAESCQLLAKTDTRSYYVLGCMVFSVD